MAIKITRATDSIITKNLILVLFGQPGSGKSSLAFSADKPLLLDFDLGAQRAIGRKDSVQIFAWEDVANLTADDLVDYNTIVVDTIGRLLECLIQDLAKRDPKLVRKSGELTLQGYGALAVAYKSWVNKIKSFGKDLVLISHDKEDKNGDSSYVRLDIAGSTKQEVLKVADLLGYVYMDGNKRAIDFNPTEFHLGKNCAGFVASEIPNYAENQSFLADLIGKTKDHMNAKSKEQIEKEQAFNSAIDLMNSGTTAEHFNAFMLDATIKSSAPLKKQLVAVAKAKGIEFDKETKQFVAPESQENVEA